MKERTLILIKPDAISKRLTGIIIDRIEHLGLDMKAAKVAIMTEDLARKHYANLAGKPFLQDVINFMRGDYNGIKDHRIYAFVYEGENAISKIRTLLGATKPENAEPNTIRGAFGYTKGDTMFNCVHASGTPEDAKREIELWFKPEEIIA